jgi:CspA family cold shock protein
MEGKVKFFLPKKNFGFIIGEDGKEYFFHKIDLEDKNAYINKDNDVSFEVEKTDRGIKAAKIKIL